ncbi:hypothetical protein SAMN04488066_103104 [Halorubrum aquaticum]|uniref:Uncharacterized protein n=1 Tax=Halorubrum aquaticum TaxID=387340 RepID=A0A1I2ZVB2_9EURY|nr:hypothetical protein [Halorubrum aquaticum]SFH41021.1 hypothetical protein SAMN04488066_103104 [Halorubrum aquaticum]
MRPLAAVGVAAVAVGFLVAVDRGLASTLDLSFVVVTLIGVLSVLQGVRYASARRGQERRSTDLGEPERRERAAVPGADFDAAVSRAASVRRRRGRTARDDVRSRVRTAAVRAVARERNCSRERAAELVDEGDWTDDRTAAAFCSRSIAYPIRDQILGGLPGRSTFRAGVTAAVDALERATVGIDAGADRDGERTAGDGRGSAGDGRGSAGDGRGSTGDGREGDR